MKLIISSEQDTFNRPWKVSDSLIVKVIPIRSAQKVWEVLLIKQKKIIKHPTSQSKNHRFEPKTAETSGSWGDKEANRLQIICTNCSGKSLCKSIAWLFKLHITQFWINQIKHDSCRFYWLQICIINHMYVKQQHIFCL